MTFKAVFRPNLYEVIFFKISPLFLTCKTQFTDKMPPKRVYAKKHNFFLSYMYIEYSMLINNMFLMVFARISLKSILLPR
jgi:hypothetical protein